MTTGDWQGIWQILDAWHREGCGIGLATVVETWGSAPRKVGSQLIVDKGRRIEGSVSGGCIEGEVIEAALAAVTSGKPKLLTFAVSNETAWRVGLACGGKVSVLVEDFAGKAAILPALMAAISARRSARMITDTLSGAYLFSCGEDEIGDSRLKGALKALAGGRAPGLNEVEGRRYFLEVFNPPVRIVVVGAVHIAQALAPMALALGHEVLIIDPRSAFATPERFPGIKLMSDWPDEALGELKPDQNTAVITLTHDPKIDDPALIAALKSPAFYIAALGSRKTQAARLERLAAEGLGAGAARIHGPAGLDIGALTPAEIALSILAEMTALLRGKAGHGI
jgi:xanthine dehydrogenase accessory factor